MEAKEQLERALRALRLEVDSSIVDDVEAKVVKALKEEFNRGLKAMGEDFH